MKRVFFYVLALAFPAFGEWYVINDSHVVYSAAPRADFAKGLTVRQVSSNEAAAIEWSNSVERATGALENIAPLLSEVSTNAPMFFRFVVDGEEVVFISGRNGWATQLTSHDSASNLIARDINLNTGQMREGVLTLKSEKTRQVKVKDKP